MPTPAVECHGSIAADAPADYVSRLSALPPRRIAIDHDPDTSDAARETTRGVAYGLIAYLWWGFAVLYLYLVRAVPAPELLAHRIVWLVPLLIAILAARGTLSEVTAFLRHGRHRRTLLLTTALLSANWFTFIWAATHDRVLELSLGYFINPLVNVLLGFVVLKERLRRAQWWSVALATTAVALLVVRTGQLPVVSLVVALTFALYGLLRKRVELGSVAALSIEGGLMWPVAVGYLVWLDAGDRLWFLHHGWPTDALLLCAGLMIAVPMVAFGSAVRRIGLATIGFLQYLAPSLQFLIGLWVFGETIDAERLTAFVMIWTALAIYSVDAWQARPRTR